MNYDLAGLGPKYFERLCQALAIKILGPGVQLFGSGPDGGREASFEGALSYPDPSTTGPWVGYGVLQAKFKEQLTGPGNDATWLRKQVKSELEAWADPTSRRCSNGRRPEYLIFATNVSLSAVPMGTGDRISTLIGQYADVIGLKDWRVWDGNQIMSYLDVHQDVAAAFAALTTPNALIAMLRETVMRSAPSAVFQVGEGQPGCEAAFRVAFEAAGGFARLGRPTGPAHEHGPGFVQYLRSLDGERDTVICALPSRPAVVVDGPLWKELCAVGGTDHGVVGAGFPSASAAGASHYIGHDVSEVEVAGGGWGPGRLVRSRNARWLWRPAIRFDSLACRDRTIWAGTKGDLRLRVAARIPWPSAALRIDSAGRRRVEAALALSGASDAIRLLGGPRSVAATQLCWTRTGEEDGRNDTWGVSYSCALVGADSRTAIAARALLQLPALPYESDTLALADVLLDFDAMQPEVSNVAVASELRMTVTEMVKMFAHTWRLTTGVLPLAVSDDPTGIALAGSPRLELYVLNERPETAGDERARRMQQMLDFAPFGTTTKKNLDALAIGVTVPLDLTTAEIEATVKRAIKRMVEDFGFTDTDLVALQ